MKTIEQSKKIIIQNIYFLNTKDIRTIKDILNKYEKTYKINNGDDFKYYEKALVSKAKAGLKKSIKSLFDYYFLYESDEDKFYEFSDDFNYDVNIFINNLPNWIINISVELNKNLKDPDKTQLIRIQKEFIKEEMLKIFLQTNNKYNKYLKTN
jgi:hypothetical protein